jgi:5-formyltetrahydrofolate cyclo-ligase
MIGLGLQQQLVERVPMDAHDFPLDMVCLPDTLLAPAKPAAG